MSDSGNLIMELDNHITSVIQNFDFTDLDVTEQIEQWVMYNVNDHIETDNIKDEILNNIDLDDVNEFYNLREKVEELEEKLDDRLSPHELECKIRAQGMMIEGLTKHVKDLENLIRSLAVDAIDIMNQWPGNGHHKEEVGNGSLQGRGRPGFAGCGNDQASDEAERSTEEEAGAGEATE